MAWLSKLLNMIGGDGDINKVDMYKEAQDLSLINVGNFDQNSRSDWWEIYPERWHQVFPYQFIVMQKTKSKGNPSDAFGQTETPSEDQPSQYAIYTLPIPPQAMNMRMIPASQVTPTLGGVVEETSANVFWDITLSGTTGTAIGKRGSLGTQMNGKDNKTGGGFLESISNFLYGDPPKVASKFRERIKTTGEMSGVFGMLSSAASKIAGTLDPLVTGNYGSAVGAVGNVSGALQNALLPTPMFTSSAVNRTQNGFSEMQQLHRFLLVYSRMKGAFPNRFYMIFKMVKTNQQWRCIISDFQIMQNAQNPHLYRYNIQLRCWNVKDADTEDDGAKQAYDRFAPGGDLAPVNIVSTKQASAGLKKMFKNF